MTLQRQLAWTLLLQGGGGVALLLATLWLGKTLGPAPQGQFNQLKSAIEFGAVLASFGLPQALYVHAQTGRIGLPAARRLAAWVALCGLPVGALLAWAGALQAALPLALPLAVAVAIAALHLQWRALTLLAETTWRFNLVTLLPQLLLLPLAAAVVAMGGLAPPAMAWGMAAAYLCSVLWAWRVLAGTRSAAASAGAAPQRLQVGSLFKHGAATWVAASLGTLAVVLLQHAAQWREGAAALGMISLALLLAQVPLTPLNYALPLLLRQRLRVSPQARVALRPASLWPALPMLALAALAAWAGQWRSDLWMGAAYDGLHRLVAWLLLAGAAEAVLRLQLVHAQAEQRPHRAAISEAVRVAVLALGVWGGLSLGSASGLVALAMWWALAAWLALATLAWLARGGVSTAVLR